MWVVLLYLLTLCRFSFVHQGNVALAFLRTTGGVPALPAVVTSSSSSSSSSSSAHGGSCSSSIGSNVDSEDLMQHRP